MNGITIPGRPPTRARPAFSVYDNVDDRTQIYEGNLKRLRPVQRVQWIEWCCRKAPFLGSGYRPTVSAETKSLLRAVLREDSDWRLTVNVYQTFWELVTDYDLDAAKALEKLVQMARGKG